MTRHQALTKLRKLLRLSRSNNAHEAASALRQAQALMRRFELSEQDAHDADVVETAQTSTGCRADQPPVPITELAAVVGRVFGCHPVFGGMRRGRSRVWGITWYGIGERAVAADYTYTVLRRQLEADTRDHLKRVRKRENRRGRSARFGLAWVQAVEHLVEAHVVPEGEATAIARAMRRDFPELVTSTPRVGDLDAGNEVDADWREGARRGAAAQLHRGMGGSTAGAPRMLGGA